MKKIIQIILSLITLFTFQNNLIGEEFNYRNKTSSIFLKAIIDWKKQNHSITISTTKVSNAYHFVFGGDARSINAIFVDINADDFDDVILEFEDEDTTEPYVLINRKNLSFEISSPNNLSIDTFNLLLDKNSTEMRDEEAKPYVFKDVDGDKTLEILFHHLFISGNKIYDPVLKFNHKTQKMDLILP